jgi:hypothetical protein
MRTLSTIMLILFFAVKLRGQNRDPFCQCQTVGTEIKLNLKENNVVMTSKYSNGIIDVKIANNTIDTIFVFKSYFNSDISASPYLYRYDKKNNELNISYAPLLPYLFTKYSDNVVLQDRIIKDYQVVYDFYKILPMYEYSFSINSLELKRSMSLIKDFDVMKLNKFKKIANFKKVKMGSKNPPIYLNIAYYKDVKTLCNSSSYFLEELKFNENAKAFKLLKQPLKGMALQP